jgi:hypothetical protein
MFGRKYPVPSSDLFATGNGALAFMRHTCDGKLGFNVGNGMYFAMRIPKLPDIVSCQKLLTAIFIFANCTNI